jgi:transposase
MRSIVRRDTGEDYEAFLRGLAKASGIETPAREDLAKLDKARKKKSSNKDWEHPHDPDARITKMKDGRTHMGHKTEHAVDMDTGAVVAVTVQGADRGDTTSLDETLEQAQDNLEEASEEPGARRQMHPQPAKEIVADKGYHANAPLGQLTTDGKRTYISEPNRGRRKWNAKEEAQSAVYANRRRIRGQRGKALMRRRGEIVERSFAHLYDSGGMRRTHLRGHDNILKRLLIHAGGFNLSLILRRNHGAGKPKEWTRALAMLKETLWGALRGLADTIHAITTRTWTTGPHHAQDSQGFPIQWVA